MIHGHWGTKEYHIWSAMLARCRTPTNKKFPRYGARGIAVCDSWQQFENFLADMGKCPDGLSLEREDNDGNYCKENCKWATAKEQARNRSSNMLVTYKGVTACLSAHIEQAGHNYMTVYRRLARGWPLERALEQTKRTYK